MTVMKLLIERNIPFVKGVLEPYFDVEYLATGEFTCERVGEADALMVRTRTHCNAELLEGSRVSFIGTATIGTDHIDLEYCREKGIYVANAPGCNAPGVAQYVLSSIGQWMRMKAPQTKPEELTLGIVGVGHVGSIISKWARNIGFKVLENDPPRALRDKEFARRAVSLGQIARECDIITFHTPLTKEGADRTWHLCDAELLGSLKKCKLLINSARGGIVDNSAVASLIEEGKHIPELVIDCWEGEPDINPVLLDRAFIATPHIAGYSKQGKQRATRMTVAQIARYFRLPMEIQPVDMGDRTKPTLEQVMESYNPLEDTGRLKTSPESFEEQRNHYSLRNEPLQST